MLLPPSFSMPRISCVGLSFALLVSVAVADDIGKSETNDPAPEFPVEDQLKIAFAELGEHWSGLDRLALYSELKDGDTKAAAKRLRDAARTSERPGALWMILSELASTDLFDPVRAEVLELSRDMAARRLSDSGRLARRDATAQDDELACAHLYDKVIGDRRAARACYERVIGEERARRIARGRKISQDDEADLNERERGAASRLIDLVQNERQVEGEVAP